MSTYVDTLFDSFRVKEQAILTKLKNADRDLIDNFWGKYVDVDNACAVNVTRSRSLQSCAACSSLARLGPLDVDRCFTIECGYRVGTDITINRRPSGKRIEVD